MTANTHLEHPEDRIFDGSVESVFDSLATISRKTEVSVKWDGSPALVWGNCPSSGRFFVGTKSVFNKRLVKINYNHHDIDRNHDGEVAKILHVAFECLPIPSAGYLQGDFIGFGGVNTFCPNTIQYKFPFVIDQSIIVALHTSYVGGFLDATPTFGVSPDHISWKNRRMDQCYLIDPPHAYVQSNMTIIDRLITKTKIRFLSRIAKYPVSRTSKQYIKSHINSYIRAGHIIPSAKELYETLPDKYKSESNINLFRIYHIIYNLKNKILKQIIVMHNGTQCYIDGQPTDHEGYVITNAGYTNKFVDRLGFSRANFTLDKNWTNEKV